MSRGWPSGCGCRPSPAGMRFWCTGPVPPTILSAAQPAPPDVTSQCVRKRLQPLVSRRLGVLASYPDRIGDPTAGATVEAGGGDDDDIGVVADRNVVAQQRVGERAIFATGRARQS